MYSIAFVTYKQIPNLSEDDFLVTKYLEEKGIKWAAAAWNDENINWKEFDAVILRSCWDYYLNYNTFLEWLNYLEDNKVKVLNSIPTIKWNLDKSYLLKIAEKGFQLPESILLKQTQANNLRQILEEKNWKKAVLKPTVSAGAYETWLVDLTNVEQYQEQFKKAVTSKSFIFQEYIEEIETQGEISLVFFNKKYSHAVLKRPKQNDFRVQLKFGGGVESYKPSAEIIKRAQAIIDLYKDDLLYARVDGVFKSETLYLMELELIEPNLYLEFDPKAPRVFSDAIIEALSN